MQYEARRSSFISHRSRSQLQLSREGTKRSRRSSMASEHMLFPDFVRCRGSVSMDEEVWRDLPQALVDSLIHLLPLCERVPLRLVSKAWLEATVGLYPGDAEVQALPVMVGDSSLTIYNVRRNIWRQKSMKDVYLNDAVKGFESAGGLICAITKHSENLMIVHNPTTNKTKYLLPPQSFRLPVEPCSKPPYLETPRLRYLHNVALHYDGMTGLYRGMIGFICDEENCKYTIIMACTHRQSPRTTYVYDSVTGNWSEGGTVPEGLTFWYGGDNRIVCNGSLYCLAKGRHAPQGLPECMLAKYVLNSQEWIIYPVPEVGDGTYPFLVEHRKSVIFITQNHQSETLHLYKLNELNSWHRNYSWQLLSRLPTSLWNDFTARGDPNFTRCVGQKNLIYLTGRRRKGSGVVALVFDPTRAIYKWLPHVTDDHLIFQLRLYKPSLQQV